MRTSCRPRTRRDVQAAGAATRDTNLLQRLNDDERSDNEVLHGGMVDRKHGQDGEDQ